MDDWPRDVDGVRLLVVGASSGIGEAVAVAARSRGCRIALAARRIERLDRLCDELGGLAYELDVSDPDAIERVVGEVGMRLGGIDAIVYTSAVAPFAHVEDTDFSTWMHAFAVNATGASHVLRTALPHLTEHGVVVVTSSHTVGRPRPGAAAYNASKAALDEILRSWRVEHPGRHIIRVSVGHTHDTEILRGADQELLSELFREWTDAGSFPMARSDRGDVANAIVSLIATARRTPSVVPDVVHLAPVVGKTG